MNDYPILPDKFSSRVNSYGECSFGAIKVNLLLASGRKIYDVIIGGDAICRIGQKQIKSVEDLDFSVSDIADVEHSR